MANYSLYTALLLIVSAAVWASVAEVDRVVVAKGRLVSTAPNLVVQPLETSIIRDVKVGVGRVVKKGDVLVVLDPTFAEADVGSLRNRFAALMATRQRLKAEINGLSFAPERAAKDEHMMLQERIHRQRVAELTARLASFDERIAELAAQYETNRHVQASLENRLAVARDIEAMREQLYQAQHGSRLLALASKADSLQISQELEETVGRNTRLRHEQAAISAERTSFIEEWHKRSAEELAEVMQSLSDVREKLSKAEKIESLVALRAPSDAVVLQVADRSVGAVVRGAEPLVTLVPLNTRLRAEVEVSTSDIGRIRIGDNARIKLDAFPFQVHGALDGRVRIVGGDTLSRETDTAQIVYYVVHVEIQSTELRNVPPDSRLLPGMTLSAEVKVGRRTVISYLLHPLIRVFDEGLREP